MRHALKGSKQSPIGNDIELLGVDPRGRGLPEGEGGADCKLNVVPHGVRRGVHTSARHTVARHRLEGRPAIRSMRRGRPASGAFVIVILLIIAISGYTERLFDPAFRD